MRVRLLTFNAGLLKIFGRSTPTPYVPERLAALPAEIRKVDADIVLLQEIYGERVRQNTAKALKSVYPYALFPNIRRRFLLANGLMTLSRFPVAGGLALFRDASPDESWIDSKGLLTTTHLLAEGTELCCINVHTTAGGIFRHPESEYIDRIRARQIEQILERERLAKIPTIIAGDLNAGPGVSESNFRQIVSAGFVSMHDHLHGEVLEPTWDPANSLNVNGPHKHCPPQRIDHVLIRARDINNGGITPISSELCFKNSVVPVDNQEKVSLSDHYGLLTEFEMGSSSGSEAATS